MAKRKDPGQDLVLADGLVSLEGLDLAAVNELRSGVPLCPRCGAELRIEISEEGAFGVHRVARSHEPEDRIALLQRDLLGRRLKEIFPGSALTKDLEIGSEIGVERLLADWALVSPNGARMLIFIWGREEHTRKELTQLRLQLKEAGLHGLWMIDGRRLRKRPEETKVQPVSIKKLETALLAGSQPLIYLGPEPARIYRVFVPQPIHAYSEREHVKSIGRLRAAVRRYPLSQLRVRSGSWALEDPRFDAPLPDPPELPKRLQRAIYSPLVLP